jgi:hypothetical protein
MTTLTQWSRPANPLTASQILCYFALDFDEFIAGPRASRGNVALHGSCQIIILL